MTILLVIGIGIIFPLGASVKADTVQIGGHTIEFNYNSIGGSSAPFDPNDLNGPYVVNGQTYFVYQATKYRITGNTAVPVDTGDSTFSQSAAQLFGAQIPFIGSGTAQTLTHTGWINVIQDGLNAELAATRKKLAADQAAGDTVAVNEDQQKIAAINSDIKEAAGTVNMNSGQAAQATADSNRLMGDVSCTWNSKFSLVACLNIAALWVGNLILSLAALFLFIVSILFDYIISGTVAGMGGIIQRVGTIAVAWRAARDIANAFFIFILLYLAIATILDLGVETKKQVIRVIVMALLINFSLFFTSVMIDASNLIATGFYNATLKIAKDTAPPPNAGLTSGIIDPGSRTGSISSVFLNAMALQGIYNYNSPTIKSGLVESANTADPRKENVGIPDRISNTAVAESSGNKISFSRILVTTIFGTMVMFTTALVLLASISLFGARVATLLVCMVFSPIAFALMAVPGDKYSEKLYWGKLVPQLLFAPVYMLFLFLTIQIVRSLPPGSFSASNDANLSSELGAIFAIFYNYIIVNTLIMTTLVSANEIGIEGASAAMEWVQKGKGALQSVVGRNTIGWWARGLDEKWANTNAPRGFNWLVGGQGIVGSKIRGSTTGFLKDAKFGGEKSAEDVYHEEHVLRSAQESNRKKDAVIAGLRKGDKDAVEQAWGKLSGSEKIEMLKTNKGLFNHRDMEMIGEASTDQDIESIDKSDDLTQQEKDELKHGKFDRQIAISKLYKNELDKYEEAFSNGGRYNVVDKNGKETGEVVDFSAVRGAARNELYAQNMLSMRKWDKKLATDIQKRKGLSIKHMHQIAPDLFTDNKDGRITENIDHGPIEDARRLGFLSVAAERKLRLAKGTAAMDATAMAYGIDVSKKDWREKGIEERGKLLDAVGEHYVYGGEDAMGEYLRLQSGSLTQAERDEYARLHHGDQDYMAAGEERYRRWMSGKGPHEFWLNRGAVRNSSIQRKYAAQGIISEGFRADDVDKDGLMAEKMARYTANAAGNITDDFEHNDGPISEADATAMDYWLNNRVGKEWRDNRLGLKVKRDRGGVFTSVDIMHPETIVERAQIAYNLNGPDGNIRARKYVTDDIKWRARRTTAMEDAAARGVPFVPNPGDPRPDPRTY
ncbi:MAG: hypothetical protein PHS53_01565 [Candidatus Pacebacteria bacterium]|nr:hypothetical protein [Candidatus Paceibacterota bacterium]